MAGGITLSHPLPGSTATDRYGWRDPIPAAGIYDRNMHNGQDYAAPSGTPIKAAHAGTVSWSGWDTIGGGWGVMLTHPDGWATFYFHMRERSTDVTIGQRVTAGQTIGRVGATGAANGAHLHFMLRVNGIDIDPAPHVGSTVTPSTPSNNDGVAPEEIGEEMFIAVINGSWYLIVPQGNAKPRAVVLGADSAAGKSGIPVVNYTWPKSIDQLKKAVVF